MPNTIYALIESKSRTKFYIGQTFRDPAARLSEHRYGTKNCNAQSEDKYKYASALDALGIEWEMIVLAEIEAENDAYSYDDVEDYYVNLYRSEPLQNMRAGNQEPWFGVDYKDVESMLSAKKRYLDRKNFKEPKVKKEIFTDPEKTLYSFEKPEERFMSPAMREILAKRTKK